MKARLKKGGFLMIIALFGVVLVGCTAWAPSDDVVEDIDQDGVIVDDNDANGNNTIQVGQGGEAGAQENETGLVDENTTINIVGTEPFWNVKIDLDGLTWSAPAMEGSGIIEESYAGLVVSQGQTMSTYTDTANTITVMLSEGNNPCSDGMSDTAYPYSATVEYQGETYNGCAELENL